MNRAQLLGHIGKDPEILIDKNGKKFVSFSICTNDRYKDKTTGERKENAEWHKVLCFEKHLCELMEKYAPKGRQIYVEGKLHTSRYQKDEEESDRYSTKIIASYIDLLGDKMEAAQE